MKGSHAFELHEKAKFKELEEYLAQLDKAVAKLQGARKWAIMIIYAVCLY